jgi:hypothetical protein
MHTLLISISVSLIALAGGMFLLEKTNKDNLGLFFKVIAYLIIILSLLILACTAIKGSMNHCGKSHRHLMGYEEFMDDHIRPMGKCMGSHGMGRHGTCGGGCMESGCMSGNSCTDCCMGGFERQEKCCTEMKDSSAVKMRPDKDKTK